MVKCKKVSRSIPVFLKNVFIISCICVLPVVVWYKTDKVNIVEAFYIGFTVRMVGYFYLPDITSGQSPSVG